MTDLDDAADSGALDIQAPSSQHEIPHDQSLNVASIADPALSKRPRDARLIHMILAHYGVSAYQERVPLQLMDFAYRYTQSTLSDALHLTNEGHGTSGPGIGTSAAAGKGATEGNTINISALRLAIHSRTAYQYSPTLPKEFYEDLAAKKNTVALPPVKKEYGLQLPPEQYMLTGQGWEMAEEFDMEEQGGLENGVDATMLDQDGSDQGEGEVEGGTMEDIFGPDGGGGEGDEDMEED